MSRREKRSARLAKYIEKTGHNPFRNRYYDEECAKEDGRYNASKVHMSISDQDIFLGYLQSSKRRGHMCSSRASAEVRKRINLFNPRLYRNQLLRKMTQEEWAALCK